MPATIFEEIVRTTPDPVILLDCDGAVMYWNPAAEALFGYSFNEIHGRCLADLIMSEEDAAAHERALLSWRENHAEAKPSLVTLRRARTRSGKPVTVELSLSQADVSGEHYFVGILRDVTERVAVQEELRTNSETLDYLRTLSTFGEWEFTRDDRTLHLSDQARIFGGLNLPPTLTRLRELLALIHPDDRSLVLETSRHALRNLDAGVLEHRITVPDGSIRYLRHKWRFEPADSTRWTRVRGVTFDVTHYVAGNDPLTLASQRQAALADLGHTAMQCDDLSGVWQEALRAVTRIEAIDWAQILEHDVQTNALIERAASELVPHGGERWMESLGSRPPTHAGYALQKERPVVLAEIDRERRFVLPPGWSDQEVACGICVPIETHDRTWGILCLYARDARIFDRATISFLESVTNILGSAVEHAAAAEAQRLDALAFNSGEPVVITDGDYNIVRANDAFLQLTGCIGGAQDTACRERLMHTLEAAWEHAINSMEGEQWQGEGEIQRDDGTMVPVWISSARLSSDNPPRTHFVINVTVLAHLKQQEQIMRQAEKMNAVGQLTGGVAHDFNNLLSIISGNAQYLHSQLSDDQKELDEVFDDIESAVTDGTLLTKKLLAFSRAQPTRLEVVLLGEFLPRFIQFLRRVIADQYIIELEPVADDLEVEVDSGLLENALINLAVNSTDAMSSNGKITITAEHRSIADEQTGSRWVAVTVADTGPGISEEDLPHVFEPFFTTKEQFRGSGLGLSMVYGFARQSGGRCEIDSVPGEGTRVRLLLPEYMGNAAEKGHERPTVTDGDHAPRVLIVEDETRVRKAAQRMLATLGCEANEADSAEAAIALLEENPKFDIVFSDVLMPGGMDGWQLAQWIEEHLPGIKVLLTSGYIKDDLTRPLSAAERFPILYKPYSIERLSSAIRDLIGD